MLFEEYIKIFEEVLNLTKKIYAICEKGKSEEAEQLFHERNALMQKLSVPEDIDDEKFARVLEIKGEISDLNAKILKAMEKEKKKAQGESQKMKETFSANQTYKETTEIQLKNNYKNPKSSGGGSIFS